MVYHASTPTQGTFIIHSYLTPVGDLSPKEPRVKVYHSSASFTAEAIRKQGSTPLQQADKTVLTTLCLVDAAVRVAFAFLKLFTGLIATPVNAFYASRKMRPMGPFDWKGMVNDFRSAGKHLGFIRRIHPGHTFVQGSYELVKSTDNQPKPPTPPLPPPLFLLPKGVVIPKSSPPLRAQTSLAQDPELLQALTRQRRRIDGAEVSSDEGDQEEIDWSDLTSHVSPSTSSIAPPVQAGAKAVAALVERASQQNGAKDVGATIVTNKDLTGEWKP